MGSNDQMLTWNTHSKTILDGVKSMLNTEKYTDVTLVAGGEFFPAHRVILGACSEYFEMLFSYADNPKPFIVLDQPSKFIRGLLDYIYVGEVQIPSEDMKQFFKVAQFLKVRGLYVTDDDDPLRLSNHVIPPITIPADENAKFQENLRLSLAHVDYLGSKYRPKGIPSATTIAPSSAATTTTVSAIPNTVNFDVTNPFSLNVVTNQLFGGANTRGHINAYHLKPIMDGKRSPPLRKTPPPAKRKRAAYPSNEAELASEQQPPQQKAKNAKTRSNPPSRMSPVNACPASTSTLLQTPSTIFSNPNIISTTTSNAVTTILLTTAIPSTTTTTTSVLPLALLDKLESQGKLMSEKASGGQHRMRQTSSPTSFLLASSSAAASSGAVGGEAVFADSTDSASREEALNLMPQVKIEMEEDPDEQRLLDHAIGGPDQIDGDLHAKTEPEDSDSQRELLVDDDDAAAGDEGGHEGRSSSSSSSQGTEGGSSGDANGSSVQDFLQAELQHQNDLPQQDDHQDDVQQQDDHQDEAQQHDEDCSGDDLPALVMNVDAVDDKEFKCTECDVVLANLNLLRRHLSDKHEQLRKHRCDYCIKTFKRKEHLDRHIRIHTGSKPFACEICNVRFTQKEHLKGHVENVHEKLGKKSARNKANKGRSRTTSPKNVAKRISKLTNGTALTQGLCGNPFSIGLVVNQESPGGSNNLHNGSGGLLDRMVSGEASGSGSIGDSMSANLSSALNLLVASQSSSDNSGTGPNHVDEQQQQQQPRQRLALICPSSGNSSSPPMLTSPPALALAPSHPLHSTSSFVQQHTSQFRPISRPFAGTIIPTQGLVSILTLPNINNGGSAGPATTSFMPFNPIPLSAKSIVTSLGSSVFQANLPNTRFSSSSPTHDDSTDDVPSISISNDNGSSPSELSSSSSLSSVKQITVVAGASGHVEAVVSPTRSSRRGRGRGRGGVGRGGTTMSIVGLGRGSPAGAQIALEKTKRMIGVLSGTANASLNPLIAPAKEQSRVVCASVLTKEREAATTAAGNKTDKNSSPSQQLTAVYAPVTRNSVSSPEKHMKTVVLNIP